MLHNQTDKATTETQQSNNGAKVSFVVSILRLSAASVVCGACLMVAS